MAVFRRHAMRAAIHAALSTYGLKIVYPCGFQRYKSTITFMIDAPLVSI